VLRGPGETDIALTVNGASVTVRAAPRRTLLDTLRETLALTGTKKVCDEGTCGACTVLVEGRPVYSCMTLAVACEGKAIETIGFCTPGQIMSIVGLLRETAAPTEDDVRRAVAGNLCRCGAYPNIVKAGVSAGKRKS